MNAGQFALLIGTLWMIAGNTNQDKLMKSFSYLLGAAISLVGVLKLYGVL